MNLEQERQLAQDETTASEILANLAKSSDDLVRKSVAQNPNTPVEILLNICFEFPDEVINNPVIPLLILEDIHILTCKIKIDFNKIKQLTDIEIKRLGIKKEQGRSYLQKKYGKRSRLHLTDGQLLDFLSYLRSLRVNNLPSITEVKSQSSPRLSREELPF